MASAYWRNLNQLPDDNVFPPALYSDAFFFALNHNEHLAKMSGGLFQTSAVMLVIART